MLPWPPRGARPPGGTGRPLSSAPARGRGSVLPGDHVEVSGVGTPVTMRYTFSFLKCICFTTIRSGFICNSCI